MNELLNRILQTIVVLQSCFILGISLVIMKLYLNDKRFHHIAFVAMSYILLTVLVATRYFPSSVCVPWRVSLAMVAFGFGDYALVKILWYKTEKRKP